jgi:hypothetical protein
MLLRYCSSIFIFPNQNEWAIYKLQSDGTPGPAPRLSVGINRATTRLYYLPNEL